MLTHVKQEKKIGSRVHLIVVGGGGATLSSFIVEQLIGVCMCSSLKGPTKNQKKAQKQAKENKREQNLQHLA